MNKKIQTLTSEFLYANRLFYILILLALVLGGERNQWDISQVTLALGGATLIVFSINGKTKSLLSRLPKSLNLTFLIIVLTPIIQLTPVPLDVLNNISGRSNVVDSLKLANYSGMYPITVSPIDTINAIVSLVPPLGIFLFAINKTEDQIYNIITLIVSIGMISVIIGIVQFASGGTSFIFYPNSHSGYSTGFFSNRNHFALFIAVNIMLIPIAIKKIVKAGIWRDILIIATTVSLVIIAFGTGSRSGVALSCLAALFNFIEFMRGMSGRRSIHIIIVSSGIVIISLIAVLSSTGDMLIARYGDFQSDGRAGFWGATLRLSQLYGPFGSGVGTFVDVYNLHEPLNEVKPQFVNHAHNDYVELLLEAGLFYLIGLFALILYIMQCIVKLVQISDQDRVRTAYRYLLVIGMILAHSFVDYPLRTVAHSSLFALMIAFIARVMWLEGFAQRHGVGQGQSPHPR